MRRRVGAVYQDELGECGLACLAMVATFHGGRYSLPELRQMLGEYPRGMNLEQLMAAASELGFSARALKIDLQQLRYLELPAILHWQLDHYVVIERYRRDRVVIVDPRAGTRTVSNEELSDNFTGVAIECRPLRLRHSATARKSLTIRDLLPELINRWRPLCIGIVVSLALQAVSLYIPVFGQRAIDGSSLRLPSVVVLSAILFLALVGVQASCTVLRQRLLLHVGSQVWLIWVASFVDHLLTLPLGYFESRKAGDIISRLDGLEEIRTLVTAVAMQSAIDTLLILVAIKVMWGYGSTMTLSVVIGTCCYGLARSALLERLRDAKRTHLMEKAIATSIGIETLRAIQSIKVYGRETMWGDRWIGAMGNTAKADSVAMMHDITSGAIRVGIPAAESVVTLVLAAAAVSTNSLTPGMAVAFLAYRYLFVQSSQDIVDKVCVLRLLRPKIDRLADIAICEPERKQVAHVPIVVRGGKIEAGSLSFRFSSRDSWLWRDISFSIAAGECIVIRAPSGYGKTTLLKVLMGLRAPTSGTVLFDGQDVYKSSPHMLRRQVCAVMQDDSLLSLSFAENIAFSTNGVDLAWVKECAAMAHIATDIERTPQQYNTPVGEMGSTLSGGQRQRILLARALYHRPRILFLDEATSHLDAENETRVHRTLADLRITRVIVAHRKETLGVADRVLQLDDMDRSPREIVPCAR